eukprot:2060907-Amphidinium_carterae.1
MTHLKMHAVPDTTSNDEQTQRLRVSDECEQPSEVTFASTCIIRNITANQQESVSNTALIVPKQDQKKPCPDQQSFRWY